MIGMVTFVEAKLFTKLVQEYLSDDEYAALNVADNSPAKVLKKIKEEIDAEG